MSEAKREDDRPSFAIFRARESRPLDETPAMYADALPPAAADGTARLMEAGLGAGYDVRLLFALPGISLTYVWFKSGFPLPRHSHNADCLYYVIAGSISVGTEVLGPGDGFFIGVDAPYAYVPGDDGVELLEFRTTDHFDIRYLAENPAFWNKAVEQVRSRQGAWASEPRPAAAIKPLSS